jgi:hypothetical protein
MYRLFSQTKTTGSFQTAARFTASWKAPMFVVPSPKKQAVTLPSWRMRLAHAMPTAVGMCPPTIA